MKIRQMISAAATIVGSQKALAEMAGILPQNLSTAKKGTRKLPDSACRVIAELLKIRLGDVIELRNYEHAKTAAERKKWKRKPEKNRRKS